MWINPPARIDRRQGGAGHSQRNVLKESRDLFGPHAINILRDYIHVSNLTSVL